MRTADFVTASTEYAQVETTLSGMSSSAATWQSKLSAALGGPPEASGTGSGIRTRLLARTACQCLDVDRTVVIASVGAKGVGMSLDQKLQIKVGQTAAVLHAPSGLPLAASSASVVDADAVIVYVTTVAELEERVELLVAAASRGALAWLVYPKARQLNTDLNRDVIHRLVPRYRLDTVRQIAIDSTWSGLRLKLI